MSYYIAIGTNEGSLSVICVTNELQEIFTIPDTHSGGIDALAIAHDASRLVTGGQDKYLRVWNLPELNCEFSANVGSKVWCVAVTPDNAIVLCGCDDGNIRVYSIATRFSCEVKAHSAPVTDIVCISTQYVVSGGADGNIIIWDLRTMNEIRRIQQKSSWVKSLACIDPEFAVVASGQDNVLQLWNLQNEQVCSKLTASSAPWCLKPLGPSAVVYGCIHGHVECWDLASSNPHSIGKLDSSVHTVCVSNDGKVLLAASNSQIALWDSYTLVPINTWRIPRKQIIKSALLFKLTGAQIPSTSTFPNALSSSHEHSQDTSSLAVSGKDVISANLEPENNSRRTKPIDVLVVLPQVIYLLKLIQQSLNPSTTKYCELDNLNSLQKSFEYILELQSQIREIVDKVCSNKVVSYDNKQVLANVSEHAIHDLIVERRQAISNLRSHIMLYLEELQEFRQDAEELTAQMQKITDALQSATDFLPSLDPPPQNRTIDELNKYFEDFFGLLNGCRDSQLEEWEFDKWYHLVMELPQAAAEVATVARLRLSQMEREASDAKSHVAYLEKHLQQMVRELSSIEESVSMGESVAKQAADAHKELVDVRRKIRALEQGAEDGQLTEDEVMRKGTALKKCYTKVYGKLASLRSRLEKMFQDAPELRIDYFNTRPPRTVNIVSPTAEPEISSILDTDRSPLAYIQERVISSSPNSTVYLMRLGDELCVVKVVPLDCKQQRDSFLSEVAIMRKLRHPLILPLRAAFIDSSSLITPLGYIETEYVEGGTLDQWLENERTHGRLSDWQLQSIFNSIALAVNFLHNNSIIHRDLKLQNILVKRDGTPVLIDFGASRDLTFDPKCTSTYRGFTPGYEPPEVAEGQRWTKAGDVYSFGIMMFRAFFPGIEPVILPDQSSVAIPSHPNHHLCALLRDILQKDPAKRPSMEYILSSPFLTRPLIQNEIEVSCIKKSEEILDVFMRLVDSLPKNKTRSLIISKRNMVPDVMQAFSNLKPQELLDKLQVTFIEEPVAIDAGGLLSEMYTLFFASPLDEIPCVFHPKYALMEANDTGTMFLPKCDAPPEKFEIIGTILVKTILDRRPVPISFAPIVYKYLCSSELDPSKINLLPDLEIWDKSLAAGYHKMLLSSLESQGLNGALNFDGLLVDGKSILVTDKNKYEWIQLKIYDLLVGKRKAQLEALKKGLHRLTDLVSGLKLLSPFELELVLTGQPTINAQLIISALNFEDFPPTSSTPNHMIQYLRQLPPTGLHKFVQFATGLLTIPYSSNFTITILKADDDPNMLPMAHTCNRWIHLPDYNDFEILKQKMNIIFSVGAHMEFGVA